MFASFITFFNASTIIVTGTEQGSDYISFEIDECCELTPAAFVQLIALCGDQFTFLVGAITDEKGNPQVTIEINKI